MKTFKGTVSRTHRNALAQLDHVELTAVSDVKPEKKDELAEGVHFYQDYEEMLDQEQLDAVHICLPLHISLPFAASFPQLAPVLLHREAQSRKRLLPLYKSHVH